MRPRQHVIVPSPVTGYVLNEERGFFSVIIPEATQNLVLNPSIELATTNYNFIGGSIARVATQQRYGAYSLEWTPGVSPTSYVFYQAGIDCVIGTTYTFSVDVLAPAGLPYRIYFAHGSGAVMGSARSYRGINRWQRVSVTYTEATASVDRYPTLAKEGSVSVAPIYTDGWQVEAKTYATTYCDGDQLGFVSSQAAYQWTGTAHASESTRSAQTRAGGRVVNLDQYGFRVLSYIGLGMAVLSLVSTPFALGDGAQFQRATAQSREFALAGQFDATSLSQLQRLRSDMHAALAPTAVAQHQPLVLRYQAHRCEVPTGPPLDLVCSYAGGLEGNTDNLYGERAALRFTQFLPYVQLAGSQGAAPGYQTSIASVNNILQRSGAGVWSALGTGVNDTVRTLVRTANDALFAGGDFTDAGGSGADYIAKWNGTAWSVLSSATAVNNIVYALAVAPDGVTIYVGGNFTNAGGVAAADYIATWNSSTATWGALGTGMNAVVYGITVGNDGAVYAVGDFTTAGGGAAARVAKWDGSTWAALGTGLNAAGRAVIVGSDGNIYAGGSFTLAGGVANTAYIAKWNGSAWSALSTGMNTTVRALAVGADGILYAAGDFATAGGTSAARVAQWNGAAWSPLGSGVGSDVYALSVYGGALYAGGAFSLAGGFSVPDGIALWTGSAWVPADADLPGSVVVAALHTTRAGVLTAGWFINAGTATAATVTTVTNNGSAPATPHIIFTGPGRVYQIVNTATGDALYFNLTLNAGETATLDLTPNNISFISTFRGNILNTIIPGSQLASFRLLPGANTISTFISGTVTAATSVTMIWTPAYLSVDDATE